MTRHVMPRAIMGAAIRVEATPTEILQQLSTDLGSFKASQKTAFEALEKVVADFRASNDEALKKKADVVLTEQVDRVNAAVSDIRTSVKDTDTQIKAIAAEIDKLNEKQAALTISGGASGKVDPRTQNAAYPEYAKAFTAYFRRGESAIPGGENALKELGVKAAMSIGSDPDGGYTVLPEIETTIDSIVKQISPMRDLATVMQIGTSEYKKLVNQHGTASGWVGESDSRPQTAGSQLSELKFPVMEVYAMPAASQSLLDDAFLDIGAWIAGEVQLEFAQKEGAAFIAGDGVNKPSGFLGGYPIVANPAYSWGKIGYVPTGASGSFVATTPPTGADCLVDLYHAPKSPYRINSTWAANRTTLGAIRKLKDGQGNYLLNMVLRPEGFIEEILGRPAVEMPDMPDIAANSYSVAFGDFKRGYLIVDRVGIRVLRDAYTAKPYVLFYTTKRVGGGIQNFEAIKLLKFSAT
nr:MAG TPA: major capsid protein [Caudoviricetes sp.]